MKEGEREFSKFQLDTSAQDPEYEKVLEQLIQEKIDKGYDDERILEEIYKGQAE